MYKTIVRSKVRSAFRNLSAGDFEKLFADFHEEMRLQMAGDHPLGGERRGKEAVREWFAEVHRLFPDLSIEPLTILVNGGPWDMRVATRFRVTSEQADYANEGMQFLRLRWGKAVEDRLYEDTQELAAAIERQAAAIERDLPV